MAFPNYPVLDDFNRADAAPMTGLWWPLVDTRIASNKYAASGAETPYASYAGGIVGDGEMYVTAGTASMQFDIYLRCDRAMANGYVIEQGSGSYRLYRTDASVFTALATAATHTCAASDQYGIQATGSSIKAYLNGTNTKTGTDSTYKYGLIGIGFWSPATGTFDNLGGGPLYNGLSSAGAGAPVA